MDFGIPTDSIFEFHPDVFDINSDSDISLSPNFKKYPEQELSKSSPSLQSPLLYLLTKPYIQHHKLEIDHIAELEASKLRIETEYQYYLAELINSSKPKTRRPKILKTESQKDEKYWARRKKNTEAARKSRQRANQNLKLYIEQLNTKIALLDMENQEIKALIEDLRTTRTQLISEVLKLNLKLK